MIESYFTRWFSVSKHLKMIIEHKLHSGVFDRISQPSSAGEVYTASLLRELLRLIGTFGGRRSAEENGLM